MGKPREKHYCENHPGTLTTRKCYHCHKPICSECQLLRDHHFFCSKFCNYKFRLRELLPEIRLSIVEKRLIAIFFIFALIIIFYLQIKINQLSYMIPLNTATATVDSILVPPPPVSVDSLRTPLRHILHLSLKAENGSVVTLRKDGRFISTAIQNYEPLVFDKLYLHQGANSFAIWKMDASGNSSLIDSFTIDFKSKRITYLSRYITQVRTTDKSLALTFDGGSANKGTQEILDILKTQQVHSTMFLTAAFISAYPDLVQQMINDGHEIANHSMSHPHLTELEINGSTKTLPSVNREFVYHQLLSVDSLFKKISGKNMVPFWRAPFGEVNNEILLWAAEAGYKHIGWSRRCDTWDWVADTTSKLYRTPTEILHHILKIEQEKGLQGKIILMHLSTERSSDYPYLILDDLIGSLKKRGYRFARVSNLINHD